MPSQFPGRHAAGHDDLEGALAKPERRRVWVFRRCFMQSVKAVATPVEFFLQRDHAGACRLSFGAGGAERVKGRQGAIAEGSREIGRKALRCGVEVGGEFNGVLGDQGELADVGCVKCVSFIPGCVLDARTLRSDLVAALVLTSRLQPEARGGGVEEANQAQVFVLPKNLPAT